ncbi:MAG TPA: Flp pilus assembly protein CpaB [Phenylobacterium sp.]
MRVVTIVSLGACAVFGLGALVVAKTMLPNAASAKVAAIAAPPPGVPVVVAKAALKYGDRLDATKVVILKLPSDAVPEGAFATVAQVLAQDNGGPPVALTPISAREPLLPAKLSGPGARASVAAEIADGFRAYTIKVSDVTGVGGHALPGDRVDVMLIRDLTPKGDIRTWDSQVVIQNLRVLGVDLNADPVANRPATPSTATLEVSVADAQKLSVAADLGSLQLVLRKTGSTEIAQTAPVRTTTFLGGAAPSAPTGLRRARTPSGPEAPKLITIVANETKGGHQRSVAPKKASAPPPPPPTLSDTAAGSSSSSSSKPA